MEKMRGHKIVTMCSVRQRRRAFAPLQTAGWESVQANAGLCRLRAASSSMQNESEEADSISAAPVCHRHSTLWMMYECYV